jgi:hypothetical protein
LPEWRLQARPVHGAGRTFGAVPMLLCKRPKFAREILTGSCS